MLLRSTLIDKHRPPCHECLPVPTKVYSPAALESRMKDAEVVSQMILEINYQYRFKTRNRFFDISSYVREQHSTLPRRIDPYLDAVTKGLYALCTKPLTVTNIFLARVISDINFVLDDKTQDGYSKLLQEGATADHLLGHERSIMLDPKRSKGSHIESLQQWGTGDAIAEATSTLELVNKGIKANMLGCVKRWFMDLPAHSWDTPCDCCTSTAIERIPDKI